MSFVNQKRIMTEIYPIITSIQRDNSYNILFQGPAGCGKTTLAKKVCAESMEDFSFQIPKKGDVVWEAFNDYRVNLIDEIHTFKNWENLYPLMDSGKVFVFCTTEYGEVPEPFLSRCLRFSFDPYSIKDLATIIKQYAVRRQFKFDEDSCYTKLAKASRGSPRLAKQRFDRIKLLITYYETGRTDWDIIGLLNQIGIFKGGYTQEDYRYLEYLNEVGTSSISNISATLQIDQNTIQKEIEPFLLEKGHVKITAKGRQFISWPYNQK